MILVAGISFWTACESDSKQDVKQGGKKVSWVDVARLGKAVPPGRLDESIKRLASRGLEAKAAPVLDDMAATSADGAGIKQARARLAQALPGFADPKNKSGGGDEPNVGAVKQCALMLYHGLLARAGAAVRALPKPDDAAIALVEAARGIEGYREGLMDELMDELSGALGHDLFDRASASLDARTKK